MGPGLNVGKAVMAGLVLPCAGHPRGAVTNLSPAQTSVSSEAYDEIAMFSWMGGSSPAMTENGILAPPTPNALRADFFIWIRRNPLKSPDSAKEMQGNAS